MKQRVCLFAVLVCGLIGCAHSRTRLQAEDENERDKEAEVKTIGDVSTVANADAIPVSGIGLVVGLAGTGGGAPPGAQRQRLEDQMRKRRVENIKEILASPNTSLVLVQGSIPAGARKGDLLDIEVTVPRESKTSSLRGGQLVECVLLEHEPWLLRIRLDAIDMDDSDPDRASRSAGREQADDRRRELAVL